ncbi:MAG: hypothetical protein QME94_18725, partial [Anaerolineae bacterium]|nr:hypothetical protein [Anaerolineae bacterium]
EAVERAQAVRGAQHLRERESLVPDQDGLGAVEVLGDEQAAAAIVLRYVAAEAPLRRVGRVPATAASAAHRAPRPYRGDVGASHRPRELSQHQSLLVKAASGA